MQRRRTGTIERYAPHAACLSLSAQIPYSNPQFYDLPTNSSARTKSPPLFAYWTGTNDFKNTGKKCIITVITTTSFTPSCTATIYLSNTMKLSFAAWLNGRPLNIFPLLFPAEHGLGKLGAVIESPMLVLTARSGWSLWG